MAVRRLDCGKSKSIAQWDDASQDHSASAASVVPAAILQLSSVSSRQRHMESIADSGISCTSCTSCIECVGFPSRAPDWHGYARMCSDIDEVCP